LTFADKVILFLRDLDFSGSLPEGIEIMNPFRENPEIIPLVSAFYENFYGDHNSRHLILGINPGRFGAGATGIPFTDSKRLQENCGLSVKGLETYETSSVFIYKMIDAYGGVYKFYGKFFISSLSPLGFTSISPKGNTVNYNYYDSKKLTESVYGFIVDSIRQQLDFGIYRDVCFCLGTGKNFRFLSAVNDKFRFFDRIESLEHPRFIMQYKSKQKEAFIRKYLMKLDTI
jgi:hypothetical protein